MQCGNRRLCGNAFTNNNKKTHSVLTILKNIHPQTCVYIYTEKNKPRFTLDLTHVCECVYKGTFTSCLLSFISFHSYKEHYGTVMTKAYSCTFMDTQTPTYSVLTCPLIALLPFPDLLWQQILVPGINIAAHFR